MTLIAIEDALTGGGIVGGVVTVAGALYVLYDKVLSRRSRARKDDLELDEQKVKIDQEQAEAEAAIEKKKVELAEMVRATVTEAYEEANRVRREAHDADVRTLKREIARTEQRLGDLETKEARCQRTLDALSSENRGQAREIADLRAKITALESELRECRVLPPPPATGEGR